MFGCSGWSGRCRCGCRLVPAHNVCESLLCLDDDLVATVAVMVACGTCPTFAYTASVLHTPRPTSAT
eukprot:m.127777 g.127777  ORF g.127777 m.127777 type:complete len:67 (+) comp11215_c0_seq4:147-347(+)